MRTFHIGGAAQINEQSNLEAVADGTIEYRELRTITDPRGRHVSLSRSGEVAIIDSEGRDARDPSPALWWTSAAGRRRDP